MKRLIALLVVCLAASTVSAEVYTVTNTNDSGPGSLRQAIIDSNAVWGNTIAFNITSPSKRILLLSELPHASVDSNEPARWGRQPLRHGPDIASVLPGLWPGLKSVRPSQPCGYEWC
jgi:hypothetical protein